MSENYVIEIGRRAVLAEEVEMLRTHTADTPEDAEIMIDALRESYQNRDHVVWEGEEVDEKGFLNGRSVTHDSIYTIRVTPPLKVTL
jgi:hypothetical protein